MATNRLPPRHGDLLGRSAAGYVLDAIVGEGGMGAVYSARCELLGKRAAVKVMLAEYTERRDAVERFTREALAAARVSDPNIIDIYAADRFAEDGRLFLVMPYIEGGSLEALCRRTGPLPLDVTAAILMQVASGLDAVHAVAIVHRDIKAENILVTRHFGRKYFVYIADFGVAKLLDPHLAHLTRTKAIIGTAGAMAPEQARGERDIDARADVYSVGVMLYRMLTGRLPYEDASLYAVMEKQLSRAPFPRPRQLRSEIPPVWEDAILHCLEVDRGKRMGSMRELAHRIAKGLPSGEMMLRLLAPRLCVDAPRTTGEGTLTGDLEASIARWTEAAAAPRRRRLAGPIALTVAAGVAIGGVAFGLTAGGGGAAARTGTLRIDVAPAAEIYVDGGRVGTSPATLTIAAGSHRVRLEAGARHAELDVTIGPAGRATIDHW